MTNPPGVPAPSRDRVLSALRHLANTYMGARRAGGELRGRLVAIEHQRTQMLEQQEGGVLSSRSDEQLAEIERVRLTIARSSAASAEHLRALEAVIAAVAQSAVAQPLAPPVAAPRPVADAPRAPTEPAVPTGPAFGSHDLVHGGWSAPPPEDDGRLR